MEIVTAERRCALVVAAVTVAQPEAVSLVVAVAEVRVGQPDVVAPVPELRVVITVGEILHGDGFDAGGLQSPGDLEGRARRAPSGEVVAGDLLQALDVVLVPRRHHHPAVVTGTLKRPVHTGPTRR